MMDLTKKALPNTVVVGGKAFSIYTDFRPWMRFEIAVGKLQQGETIDISYLFKNDMPGYCNLAELFVFSRPEAPLPRKLSHSSSVIALDYELDSELIYAAFLGQYGIDLFEVKELHWHKFLALLKGLNENTKLREVMGYRCYEKSNDKKDPYEEMRRAWEIESPANCIEQAELKEFSDLFE